MSPERLDGCFRANGCHTFCRLMFAAAAAERSSCEVELFTILRGVYTLRMIRRVLPMLLLCMAMIGLAPSWACASPALGEDCCPPGSPSPCAPERAMQQAVLACCVVQAPQSVVAAIAATRNENISGVSFDSSDAGLTPAIPTLPSLASATPAAFDNSSEWQDQSHLYLLTGRLRL